MYGIVDYLIDRGWRDGDGKKFLTSYDKMTCGIDFTVYPSDDGEPESCGVEFDIPAFDWQDLEHLFKGYCRENKYDYENGVTIEHIECKQFEEWDTETEWIIGFSGSNLDDVRVWKVIGSDKQVRTHMIEELSEYDPDALVDDIDSGTLSPREIVRRPNGKLYGYICFHDEHIDITATPVRIMDEPTHL